MEVDAQQSEPGLFDHGAVPVTVVEAAALYVLTLTPVTSLVSGRVFTLFLPQDVEPVKLPCVLLQQIGDNQSGHLRGTAALKWARVQIDCIATSTKAARELDQALMGGYDGGATGLLGAIATVDGSPGVRMKVDPKSMGYREERGTDESKNQKRTMRDYKVWIESI